MAIDGVATAAGDAVREALLKMSGRPHSPEAVKPGLGGEAKVLLLTLAAVAVIAALLANAGKKQVVPESLTPTPTPTPEPSTTRGT
jgi:hypothetical protein